ncbi:MAG: formate dehydrogenase accessory sulfurtransferase FdhD [Terriglobia bacterium]
MFHRSREVWNALIHAMTHPIREGAGKVDAQQSRRSVEVTSVSEWRDGKVRRLRDDLASEEPLQICVGKLPLTVTMRTPGHDFELASGFLFTEGLVARREQILSLDHCSTPQRRPVEMSPAVAHDDSNAEGNTVQVEIAQEVALGLERVQRNFFASSSCGLCGKASIDSLRVRGVQPPNPGLRIDPKILCGLTDRLLAEQLIFARTGGLHAAGLFDRRGGLAVLREDVGRHNAVDKVIGWALLEDHLPLSEYVLVVSGRGGFEIIQKAIVAGVPVVASVSAPSSLAVRLARELDLTLVGFSRGKRFVVYAGEHRLGFIGTTSTED